jgi:hypothetical protein
MTLAEFQINLHRKYQGDNSTPTAGTEDYIVRTSLLEEAINVWAGEDGILWNELWTTLADAADGDKTVVASTLDYDCPTDFTFLGSWVRTTNADGGHTYYQVVAPHIAQAYLNQPVKMCYVTGNTSAGFVLHFIQQPTEGETINYPYYKTPSIPSGSTDVIEMSDPWFCIYYALSTLQQNDGEGDKASLNLSLAQGRLSTMRVKILMLPWNQPDQIHDYDFFTTNTGFGK